MSQTYLGVDNSASQILPSPTLNLDLSEVIEDMFMVLTSKEKEVMIKRFSLNGQDRQTLERIGRDFNVTRERVRQIEKIALGKLRRTVSNTRLHEINKIARQIIVQQGGVMLEEEIINEILKKLYTTSKVDTQIIRLSLSIDNGLEKVERTNLFFPFWKLTELLFDQISETVEIAYKILSGEKEVVPLDILTRRIESKMKTKTANQEVMAFIKSALKIDKRFKFTEEGIGLITWRHINPKSIRDKSYIILKKNNRPMHFIEIANKISEFGFDKKMVTTQAVHNELIRHDQFVLVGRGLYALKEWGYQEGTVAEIIESLLQKKSPLTKQQIIKGVLKQRQVKKGTISLNLQKNSQFMRVGRAVYALRAK